MTTVIGHDLIHYKCRHYAPYTTKMIPIAWMQQNDQDKIPHHCMWGCIEDHHATRSCLLPHLFIVCMNNNPLADDFPHPLLPCSGPKCTFVSPFVPKHQSVCLAHVTGCQCYSKMSYSGAEPNSGESIMKTTWFCDALSTSLQPLSWRLHNYENMHKHALFEVSSYEKDNIARCIYI